MKHWVYLLKCEDKRYYVGETTRLYRRIREHCNGDKHSCIQCSIYPPTNLFGVYSVENNEKYQIYSNTLICDKKVNVNDIDVNSYDKKIEALDLENDITKMKMHQMNSKWYRVRGGNYCSEYLNNNPSIDYKYTRPFCKCIHNVPAELNIYGDKMYFRCVKKSMDWIDMSNYDFNVPVCDFEPCDFYLEVDKNNNYFNNKFTSQNNPNIKNTNLYEIDECLL
mgnify:FL=1|jgi:hypothetical protein